jgi:hypothetical protein
MDKKTVEETIIQSILEIDPKSDWVNLADLGLKIKSNGIDYKSLGFLKLTDLIRSYTDILEIKYDNSHRLPVVYVKIRSVRSEIEKQKIINSSPKSAITNWAYLGHYQTTINKLKDLALEERWHYKDFNPDYPYPILVNYFHYTFYKLTKEKSKILYSDNYAAFNTGLVDKRYEPIYALFIKKSDYTQEWRLFDFCIAGEGHAGKDLVRFFENKPKRAHYFDNVTDMLYDTRSNEPEMDIKHIILDNVSRLPVNFIFENKPSNFDLKNPEILTILERQRYFEALSSAIETDTKTYRNMTNRFKDALKLAIKRVEWNFKTAIPMYFPTNNKITLLLPLALLDDEIVDIALVVEKTKSGNYIGHTILPLSWAYTNARLVARPDSDWLVADKIETEVTEEV